MKKEKDFLTCQRIGREFPDREFEIKFEFQQKGLELSHYLALIEKAIKGSGRYVIDPVQVRSTMTTHFFSDNDLEYSIFEYENRLMLKKKRHEVLHSELFQVYCNDETFLYDLNAIKSELEKNQVHYMGCMTKKRIKDFLLNTTDGRIYSLAVTICEAYNQFQYQFEIEYNGYISKMEHLDNNENKLVDALILTAKDLYEVIGSDIIPSGDRKFDFVQRSRPNSTGFNKIDILNEIL